MLAHVQRCLSPAPAAAASAPTRVAIIGLGESPCPTHPTANPRSHRARTAGRQGSTIDEEIYEKGGESSPPFGIAGACAQSAKLQLVAGPTPCLEKTPSLPRLSPAEARTAGGLRGRPAAGEARGLRGEVGRGRRALRGLRGHDQGRAPRSRRDLHRLLPAQARAPLPRPLAPGRARRPVLRRLRTPPRHHRCLGCAFQ